MASQNTPGVITINPEYFERAVNDYSTPAWAVVRELFQNGADAPGCTEIAISYDMASSTLTVWNNGAPMDEDTLFNKFLALGGSDKKTDGSTVGGFGRAKELYFCQRTWRVETGEFLIEGIGGNFETTRGQSFVGTKSVLKLSRKFQENAPEYQIRKFLSYCNWPGKVTYNGEEVKCNLTPGKEQCSYPFGTIHTTSNSQDFGSICIVRVKGIPMFSQLVSTMELVIIEITIPSPEALVSNRDSFKYPHSNTFWDFTNNLGNNRAAAMLTKWEITEFAGDTIRVRNKKELYLRDTPEEIVEESVSVSPQITTTQLLMGSTAMVGRLSQPAQEERVEPHHSQVTFEEQVADYVAPVVDVAAPVTVLSGGRSHKIGHQFFIANNTGNPVPEWFTPRNMSQYCINLATKWVEYLVTIHGILELDGDFSIGFVFSETAEAMWDQTRKCYFINPVKLSRQPGNIDSFVFKKRWTNLREARYDIAMEAGHEVVHAEGQMSHCESWAGRFTDVAAKIAKHIKMFQ